MWRRAHRDRRAAHYMAAMGLWHPPSTQGIYGPLPSSSCNACMSCFPDIPHQQRITRMPCSDIASSVTFEFVDIVICGYFATYLDL